jgi:hypothetical protein
LHDGVSSLSELLWFWWKLVTSAVPDAAVVAGTSAEAASLNVCLIQAFWPCMKGRFGGAREGMDPPERFSGWPPRYTGSDQMSRKMIKTIIS